MAPAVARGSGGKLAAGVRIALFDPKWDRPCDLCSRWQYADDGTVKRDWRGAPLTRGGVPTPCQSCAKPPTWAKSQGRDWKELRSLAVDFSVENRKAYARYKEFRAVNRFPDDPIVTWYSGVIGSIYEEWHRLPLERATNAALALIPYLLIQAKKR